MLRGAVREGARYRITTTANKSHEGGRELFLSRVREQSLEKRKGKRGARSSESFLDGIEYMASIARCWFSAFCKHMLSPFFPFSSAMHFKLLPFFFVRLKEYFTTAVK